MARAADAAVLEAFPEADLRLFVVWTDVLSEDGAAGALRSSGIFAGDGRVVQFHDPARVAGRALAPLVGMPALSDVARELGQPLESFEATMSPAFVRGPACLFDTLLFYGPEATWDAPPAAPPAPEEWVTQLDPGVFLGIDPARFRYGPELRARMGELARLVLDAARAEREEQR